MDSVAGISRAGEKKSAVRNLPFKKVTEEYLSNNLPT
jgi:hypothetical protein